MVGLLHAMAFMMLLLAGWVIWNNKPLTIDHLAKFLTSAKFLTDYCTLQRWACSLSPNHQFSQRFWYVVYDIALCMHTWREIRNFTRQKFRLAPDEESKICEKLDPEPESLFNFCSSGSLCGCFLQWCKRLQGCSHTPKVLICRKYWNRRKFGQNPWKSWQNPSKSGQHGTALFDFNVCRKTNDCFWRSHQKKVFMIFVGGNS